MRRGEVHWCNLRAPDKRRPVVILTRTVALNFLSRITIAPITTTVRDIPTEVLLTPDDDGVPQACVVNLDNIQTIEKQDLGTLITTLSTERMNEIEQALCFALGMDRFLHLEQ